MRAAVRAEWGKTWSVRAPGACLALAVVVVLVTAASLANDFVLGTSTGELSPDARMALVEALGPALQVGQLALAAFALQVVTAEFATGSMRTTLLAQPRRGRLLAAKAVVAGSCGALLGALLGVGGAVVVRLVLADHLGADGSLAGSALRTAVVLAAVAVLAVGVGAALRSAVGTLSAVTVLLVGTLVLPGSLGRWTPGPATAALLEGTGPDVAVGVLVLTAWAALALAVGVTTTGRRDA